MVSAWLRINRAKSGVYTMPMAIIALPMPAPSAAVIASARISDGKA